MKKMLAFLYLLIIGFFAVNGCSVGQPREATSNEIILYGTENMNYAYLGLEDPASCGGYLRNFTYCYLNTNSGNRVTPGQLSLWQPTTPADGFNRFEKISESEIDLDTESVTTSCGIPRFTQAINNVPGTVQFACEYYCFPNTSLITVPPGSVMGILYTQATRTGRGQMLAHHNQQTEGICIGRNFQLSGGAVNIVSCPQEPANVTTTLLAGAGIDPIICSPPSPPDNGYISQSPPFYYTNTITYACNTGFQLANNISQTCQADSTWSNQLFSPYCNVLNCTDPGTPDNGHRHGDDYHNGSELRFSCDDGFSLEGSERLSCYRGNWNSPIPRCVRISPSITSTSFFVTSTYQSSTSEMTSPSTSATSSANDSLTEASVHRLIAVILIVVIIVVCVIAICALVFLLVYRKSKYKSHTVTSEPVSLNTLRKPLMKNEELLETPSDQFIYDEINSYSNHSKLPQNPPPLSPVSQTSAVSINRPYGSRTPEPYARRGPGGFYYSGGSKSPSLSLRSLPSLPPPTLKRNTGSHYEISETYGQPYREDEDDEGDQPYWMPSEVEEELYLQLDHIRVKRIPNAELELMEVLGSGQFAVVNKAVWHNPNEGDTEVAVKVLMEEAEETDKIRFLQEAALMGQFTHTNIIHLHGVVTDDLNKTMIVTEFMKGGDLHHWLLRKKTEVPLVMQGTLLNFCRQICLGMTYLSAKKFVHRDLAARNVLVTDDNICKISDFGMSHDLIDENYYMGREGALVPVKWTAPEALKYRKYSSASDVWSYGCLMYEIWSLGHKPFATFKNNETIRKITSGCRLSPPPGCPKLVYEIMMKCWHPEAKKRPTFNEIMLLLLKDDQGILLIPEEEVTVHPQAAVLGADLEAGEKLYTELQHMYKC